ncbi:MAG: type II secretion system F family protein [Nanoarchaeota archaeon]|nr:type II secretion system F family protein [Nanoarchaeota archaeon]
MEIKKIHLIGISVGIVTILCSLFAIGGKYFFFFIGLGVLFGVFPFIISIINENRVANEKEEMFLEFSRNLVESAKTGTPISKSIMNIKNKAYGVLSPHIQKLANQIELGIPLNSALETLSKDISNKTISRALTLIGNAERAGGDIGEILESVAEAVSMSDKLKKERKASISTLVIQGYIIFFVFIAIIIVMQFKILPILSGITDLGVVGGGGGGIDSKELSNAFLYLLLIQGLFSGLTIGKLSEGSIKAGVKHSFVLMFTSFIVSTGANLIWGV